MNPFFKRNLAHSVLFVSFLGLSACAAPPKTLYNWDHYQTHLYQSLNTEGVSPQELTQKMEVTMRTVQASGDALPPGFRAQLGLLYSKNGQADLARDLWKSEKSFFPESTIFMDFLLNKTKNNAKE